MPLLSEHPFVPPCGITAEVLPGGECRRGGGKSSELRGKSKRCAFLKGPGNRNAARFSRGREIETLRVSQGAGKSKRCAFLKGPGNRNAARFSRAGESKRYAFLKGQWRDTQYLFDRFGFGKTAIEGVDKCYLSW